MQDTEAGDHADASLKTYHAALRWIAEYAATWYPSVTLAVAYDPEDEPAASKTEAHQHRRRHTAEDAYRDLAALVEKRVVSGTSITDAVEAVAHKTTCLGVRCGRHASSSVASYPRQGRIVHRALVYLCTLEC